MKHKTEGARVLQKKIEATSMDKGVELTGVNNYREDWKTGFAHYLYLSYSELLFFHNPILE